MEENTIFHTNQGNQFPSSGESPVQTTPSQAPLPASTPPITPPPPSSPGAGIPSIPKPGMPSHPGTILKIGAVVLSLIIVLLLLFRIVLPLFMGEKEPEKVTITYWGLWEDKLIMEGIIHDFQKEYPHITVSYTKKDIKQYRQSLVTQIAAGKGPDVYRYHNSWVGMMQGYLAPLSSDVISADEFTNTYFPVVQQDLLKNGGIYGIPVGIDTLSLFVNTELFEAAGAPVPKTWDEFIRVSKELTVKDSAGIIRTAGAALGTFDNITHAPDIIALLMAQNGTNFSKFSETKSNAAQAVEFYVAFASGKDNVWDATLDPSLTAFVKGNLGMYLGYSWDIFTMQAMNPDLKFTVHPVPNLPGRQIALASYWVEGVSAKSAHQKEAMLFMKHLTKKETLQKFYTEASKTRAFGEPYPRKDLAESLQGNPLVAPFVTQAAYATSSYFASDTYDEGLNDQMNAYLGNVIRARGGNSSTDSSIDTLEQGINQVLNKYGRW